MASPVATDFNPSGPQLHPQRQQLNDEAHARPSPALSAPARITSLTFWYREDDSGQFEAISRLAARLQLPPPTSGCVQYQGQTPALQLSWSLHSEFVRYHFVSNGAVDQPFSDHALRQVPADWLASVPGLLLVAMHVALLPADPEMEIRDWAARYFENNELIGANIAGEEALALTDLRLHHDAHWNFDFSRLLIIDHGMRSRTGGRMLSRLLEIESYRMLALLALPLAKQQMRALDKLGLKLNALTHKITAGHSPDVELLDQLSTMTAEQQDLRSSSQYRCSAAHAYYRLIKQRIGELRENRRSGLQTFSEFVERRLAPAIETCATVERRHGDLAERLSRCSALLRTRVEIAQAQESQALLASMNRRVALQLRLQQTVEGLSVGVLTYYVVALISYGAKALKDLGLPLNPDLCAGLSIPLIAAGAWFTVHQVKRHF
jgi:uncharacterized membrane-anchored protein